MRAFDTNRWVGLNGVILLVVGIGIAIRAPALVLIGVVGVGYAAFAAFGDAPEPTLEIDRTLSEDAPDPGDEVDVSLTVRNVGETWLSDMRIVDGVPPGLEATGRPARMAAALAPGEAATVEYTVTAVRGEHTWKDVRIVTRNPSGSRERYVERAVETMVRCIPTFEAGSDLPLRGLTTQYSGRVVTDVGGSGVEFHSTREYRAGDPVKRIDWNRRARTGELSTLELREERAATVVLLVDSREEAYVARNTAGQNAVERSVDAAGQLFTALVGNGDRVGLGAMSPSDCWIAPGAGTAHGVRLREQLGSHQAFASTPSDGKFYWPLWFNRIRRRLRRDAQVVFLTPLSDQTAARTARRLDAHGHLVTIVSPNETGDTSIGSRFARLERELQLMRLRRAGIRVVDWGEEPLRVAIAAAERRWSR